VFYHASPRFLTLATRPETDPSLRPVLLLTLDLMALPPSPMSPSPTKPHRNTHTVYGEAGYAQTCTYRLLSFRKLPTVADIIWWAFRHIPVTL